MKKIYSFIAFAAAAMTATAAVPTTVKVSPSPSVPTAKTITEMKSTSTRLEISKHLNKIAAQTIYFDGEETPSTDEEGWTSIGTGTIINSMYENFSCPAVTYEIDIDEMDIEGGKKYRCQPFATSQNPLNAYFGTDDGYMYFYVMDNGKNYIEKFYSYGGTIKTSQDVEENGTESGKNYNVYAEFDGEQFTVPISGIMIEGTAVGNPGVWYQGNYQTPMTISFPGAKDYSVEIYTYICPEDVPGGTGEHDHMFFFKGHEDAAYVKFGYIQGYYELSAAYEEFITANGTNVNSGTLYNCPVGGTNGIYTAYVASYNDNDKLKQVASSYYLISNDDEENWQYAGKADWKEAFFTGSYNEWTAPDEAMTADYEEHKSIPGYYRIVNPYENHSLAEELYAPCQSHKHYLYIDATDPEAVKIEPSAIGTDAGYGKGVIMSQGYNYENHTSYSKEVIKGAGFYGTMTDKTISFPDNETMLGEKDYDNGKFYPIAKPFELTLTPAPTAVKVNSEETIKVGETVTLTATVEPEDATDVELTWTSSDEAIATVDDKGSVTGIAPGEATITVSCGELSATCLITVTDTNVTISEIGVKATAEKYDLMGRRTATDAKGLMIVRQGNKIVKTVIR